MLTLHGLLGYQRVILSTRLGCGCKIMYVLIYLQLLLHIYYYIFCGIKSLSCCDDNLLSNNSSLSKLDNLLFESNFLPINQPVNEPTNTTGKSLVDTSSELFETIIINVMLISIRPPPFLGRSHAHLKQCEPQTAHRTDHSIDNHFPDEGG